MFVTFDLKCEMGRFQEGRRCSTHYLQDGIPALFATKEEESKPQANGQDEGWFSCVGLRYAEATAFGVLQTVNSLHNATASS